MPASKPSGIARRVDSDSDDALPAQVFGIPRLPGPRGFGRAFSTILFTRGFGSLYRIGGGAGPPFGNVLIAGRRPEPSRARGGAG